MIHDAAEFAGPIVAALSSGVPCVTKSFGMLLPRRRVANAAAYAADLWREVDLEPPPFGGCYQNMYIDICPPALQPTLPAYIQRRQLLRPLSDDSIAAASPPLDMDWPAAFPAVYLTLGTVFKSADLLRTAVTALADLDVGILVTVGASMDPKELGPQPGHVRVERYVPQSLILGRSRVVVSHAGSGTAFAALSHGVPQLCLPQGADQFLNAAAITRTGAGLQVTTEVVDDDAIVNAVRRLLVEPSFRSAAAAIAAEIAQMPDPDEVAFALERCPADLPLHNSRVNRQLTSVTTDGPVPREFINIRSVNLSFGVRNEPEHDPYSVAGDDGRQPPSPTPTPTWRSWPTARPRPAPNAFGSPPSTTTTRPPDTRN